MFSLSSHRLSSETSFVKEAKTGENQEESDEELWVGRGASSGVCWECRGLMTRRESEEFWCCAACKRDGDFGEKSKRSGSEKQKKEEAEEKVAHS